MSMGLVIGGVIIQNGMSEQGANLHAAGLPPALLEEFTGGDAAANVARIMDISDLGQRQAVQDAFASSLRTMWIAMCVITAVGMVSSFWITKSVLSKDHTETKTGLKEKEEGVARNGI